ncbi:hypothetical protein ACT5YT_11000 [Leuconostoc suionicum]|uniref:hypothetical protein n=1 Tax=Leuconostoc suionicum TaxID=1511761 RepID=UPI0040373D58
MAKIDKKVLAFLMLLYNLLILSNFLHDLMQISLKNVIDLVVYDFIVTENNKLQAKNTQ